MKIISFIPVRSGSKGIPGKNLVKINGKSMLEYTITASQKSKFVNRTIVCTEDNKLSKAAKKLNAEVIMRPKKFATDTIFAEPSIELVLKKLKEDEGYIPDIIVFLQNTSPLRNENDIDGAIKLLINKKFDSVLSCFSIHVFPWIVQKDGTVKPQGFDSKKRPTRQDMPEQVFENGALFITTYSAFKKSKFRLSGKIGYFKMPIERSYNIDTTQDLEDLRKFLKYKSKKQFKRYRKII